MPTFSIISYINDFHTWDEQTRLNKAEIFSEGLIKIYDKKLIIETPITELTQQQKINFLDLIFYTLHVILNKPQQTKKNKNILVTVTGILSRDFEFITGLTPNIFSTLEANDEPQFWQKFFRFFEDDFFRQKFNNQNVGMLWFYIALFFQNTTLFLKWLNLSGNFKNLPLSQQKAAWALASEQNHAELKKQLSFLVVPEKEQLLKLRSNLRHTFANTQLIDLFIQPLSPFQTYLDIIPYEKRITISSKESFLKQTETYFRSEKHWLPPNASRYPTNIKNKKLLGNGGKAHVGDYKNPMQLLGDEFQPNKDRLVTSKGSSILFDKILEYQYTVCSDIQNKMQGSKNIKVGSYNNYPCLMVYIIRPTLDKLVISDASIEAWVNLIISFFTGLINYVAYSKAISIELIRRSSFGFITPTIAPTESSFRINIGIIPSVYAEIIVAALQWLDITLTRFIENQNLYAIPDNIFYKTEAYKKYLANSEYNKTIFDCNSLLQLLFTKAEKGSAGKTTVQNIVRTAFARHKIAANVFNQLKNSAEARQNSALAFSKAIQEILTLITVKITQKTSKLTLKQIKEDSVFYSTSFNCLEKTTPIHDTGFWAVIRTILDQFIKLDIKDLFFKECLDKLILCYKKQTIDKLYFYIGTLNELLYVEAIKDRQNHAIGDGYGSDSDTEGEINNQPIYANKLITQNGMRAILGTLLGIRAFFVQTNPRYVARVYIDTAYYEVAKGLNLLAGLHNLEGTLQQASNVTEANILIYDLNACITNGQQNNTNFLEKLKLGQNKILILDCTSSTTIMNQKKLEEIVKEYDRFQAVFFVSSGLKEEQCGSDKNPYGTVRIFAKDKNTRDGFYEKIKASELPLLSAVSHSLRRKYKALGCTPNNASFFKPGAIKQGLVLPNPLLVNNLIL